MALSVKEKIITRLVNIYMKVKLTTLEQKSAINKALLFVVSEFDRVKEMNSYYQLPLLQSALKKFEKKVNKEALKRIAAFFQTKYQTFACDSPHQADFVVKMNVFLDKISKESRN